LDSSVSSIDDLHASDAATHSAGNFDAKFPDYSLRRKRRQPATGMDERLRGKLAT
jgi:hypothetical protein